MPTPLPSSRRRIRRKINRGTAAPVTPMAATRHQRALVSCRRTVPAATSWLDVKLTYRIFINCCLGIGTAGLESKLFPRELRRIFESYLKVFCIENIRSFGTLQKFVGATGEFKEALGSWHLPNFEPCTGSRYDAKYRCCLWKSIISFKICFTDTAYPFQC